MKNKLSEYFCAKTAFFTALSLLIAAFSVGIADGQVLRAGDKSVQPEAVFTNPNPITIPTSGNANPYPSTINVAGLTGTIPATPGSIKVTLNNFSHTFPDDVDMVLVGPTGAAFRFFSGVTVDFPTDNNGNPASNITFTVSDDGQQQLPNNTPLTAGTFRPATYYGAEAFPAPGPGTNFSSAAPSGSATFSSVFGGTNPNGNWNLFIRDFVQGDGGSISGGWTLEINTGGGGTPQVFDNRLDFFGNGFSDWVVLAGAEPDYLVWRLARNENPTPAAPGAARIAEIPFGSLDLDLTENLFGLFNLPAFGDYTGDGIADFNVWREGSQSVYFIQPSENNSFLTVPWGTTGDSAGFEGDYDGDGRLDPTVIRPDGDALRWFVLRSGTNTFSTFRFGSINDTPLPGADYTGNGSDDPTVIRLTASNDIIWLTGTTSGALVNTVTWGTFNTDYIIPAGDYDGDGRADFAVWRGFGSAPAANGEWLILKSTGGVINIPFGIAAPSGAENRDIALRSGDYDGDDVTDIAVWRPSNQTFYVLRSSDGQLMQQKWGEPGQVPLARFGTF